MKTRLAFFLFIVLYNTSIAQQAVVGLASPVMLQPKQTVIVKSDYFPFGTPIVKVQWPQGLSLVNETPETFVISGKLTRPYDNIRFILKDQVVDIPCRNSRKISLSTVIETAQPVKAVGIKGSFNAWATSYTLLKPIGKLPTKKWLLNLDINEGYHQYKLVIDGKEENPVNTNIVSNGMGGTNTLLEVGDPDAMPPYLSTEQFSENHITINAAHIGFYIAYWNNELIAQNVVKGSGNINITIPEKARAEKRSHIRVFACNQNKAANDLLIPLQNGKVIQQTTDLERSDLHRQIMYFMMVDRFQNGDRENDPKPLNDVLPKADYHGGDLKGIQQKIDEGFFDRLGVNTIWLSPVSRNPQGAWGLWNKQVTTKFSAYHGYWPTSYSKVDARFGSNQLFADVLKSAHTRNMNVVLDFVAHHVHIEHPLYQKHPGWATPLYLPDGTMNTERWDDHRLTTWFDSFLPTLDLQRKDVRETVADSVMFWVKNFELDGFRHDASKHVPEDFWRLLTLKIKTEQRSKAHPSFYQIGETYGSPELIGSYVNSGQMDGQFDFNTYDASVGAFSGNNADSIQEKQWENLHRTLNESFDYYGSHHLMGNISGNQDRPRFASLADGSILPNEDTKLAGWTRNIQNADSTGFQRMAQLMAFNMTLPGVPVIYYGDEYAMPGGNDPDNRRMMKFEGYNTDQQQLIDNVKLLTSIRSSNMPLLYGEFRALPVDRKFFAYERNYFGKKIIAIFSKNAGTAIIPMQNAGTWKPLFNHAFQQTPSYIQLELKANDVEIFILN